MSDEITELRHKLDEIERKTAIWRSQIAVLFLVFLAGGVGSAVWMKVSLEARVEKAEKGVLEKRKTVEAENFVVRDASGKKWASFGMEGTRDDMHTASLGFYNEHGLEQTRLMSGEILMFRPDGNPAAFLFSDESLSGLFLIRRDETKSAFAAWIDEKDSYAIHSQEPMGGKTVSFSEVRARTVKP